MAIPKTRPELTNLVTTTFAKLRIELESGGHGLASEWCVGDWTVKDLLAVRVWWTESVVDWIEAGQRGEFPLTPAAGYRWNETPRLNADIVRAARGKSYRTIRERLERGVERVLAAVDALDDAELTQAGVYSWAGKWPISRWISINTARQYATARTFIRRARLRQHRNRV